MSREFLSHPEFIIHPELINHQEIDYLEEQAILPERVSFSEFFPMDEMENGQEASPEKRRKPLWLLWHVLARIIVVLCFLILFATMFLRYPVHVTFRLLTVQSDSAVLNLHLSVLQDPSSDISYQITEYNQGASVAFSTLLEGDNPILLLNLKPDTVYQIRIFKDGRRIRGFLFNTLPAGDMPPENLPPESANIVPESAEPPREENAQPPEENTEPPADHSEVPADTTPEEETPPVNTNPGNYNPPPAPPVIVVVPAATGPVNPLTISGIFGGDADGWSIVVRLRNTDTGAEWLPTAQDEGTVMIEWQLKDDLGTVIADGTTSYEDMMNQFGIILPSSVASGSYAVDVQVNFVNTDNVTTQLDSLYGGYQVDDFIQSSPTNLPTDVTITQTNTPEDIGLIYQYMWEQAPTDEGFMNGGYWYVLNPATRERLGGQTIDNSMLGQEILVEIPDGVTTVGVYFSPNYENKGFLFTVDAATVYQEITLPDTGQTFRLFLVRPGGEENMEEPTVPAGEPDPEESTASIEEPASQETTPATEETVSEESTASEEETSPQETTPAAEETVTEEMTTPPEETPSIETEAPVEEDSSETDSASAGETADPGNTTTE